MVRQDFVVTAKPAGVGEMEVRLAVTGARVEATANGAQLVLEKPGRKIAYSRLHEADANGKQLPARIDVAASPQSAADKTSGDGGGRTSTWHLPSRRFAELVAIVNDAGAVYPSRNDPTFNDANWISMGAGIPAANGSVYAAVMDGCLIVRDFTAIPPANLVQRIRQHS